MSPGQQSVWIFLQTTDSSRRDQQGAFAPAPLRLVVIAGLCRVMFTLCIETSCKGRDPITQHAVYTPKTSVQAGEVELMTVLPISAIMAT